MGNSFFYSRLFVEGKFQYKGVRRWTKRQKMEKFFHGKGTIFELDKLIFPVKLDSETSHWCTAVVNFEEKLIELYNPEVSAKWEDKAQQFFGVIRMYLEAEYKDKILTDKGKGSMTGFRVSDWANFLPSEKEIPQVD